MSSSSGASRIETLAAALGTSVFDDVATEGASMPIVVIDGLVQIRDEQRAGADRRDPVEQPRLLAQPRLGVVEVGGHARLQARDRDVAVVVVQAREHPDQRA